MRRGNIIFLMLLLCLSVFGQSGKISVAKERSTRAGEVISQFSLMGENALPMELLQRAKAVAVFGDLKQRDVLFTKGIKGKGMLIHRLPDGSWGPPTFLNLQAMKTELGFRFLLTEKLDAVFLFMNDESFQIISGWKKAKSPKIRGEKVALGPVIGGSGADLIMKEASVIYYTFQDKKLSGEEFPIDIWSNNLRIDHDDAMNKAVYKSKYKNILSTSAASFIPDETKSFYESLVKISDNAK